MKKTKNEYCVYYKLSDVIGVNVEAENEEEAIKLAQQKIEKIYNKAGVDYCDGEQKMIGWNDLTSWNNE